MLESAEISTKQNVGNGLDLQLAALAETMIFFHGHVWGKSQVLVCNWMVFVMLGSSRLKTVILSSFTMATMQVQLRSHNGLCVQIPLGPNGYNTSEQCPNYQIIPILVIQMPHISGVCKTSDLLIRSSLTKFTKDLIQTGNYWRSRILWPHSPLWIKVDMAWMRYDELHNQVDRS
jgi:hypothetical protein